MINETGYYIVLLKRMLFLLVLYTLCRFLFYLFNLDQLTELPLMCFLHGLRFDITALSLLNAPYFFFYLQPFRIRYKRIYQLVLNVFFILINLFALLWNIADVEYFKFTGKRATWEVFSLWDDITELAGTFLADFWYLLIIYLVLALLLIYFHRKTSFQNVAPTMTMMARVVLFILGSGLAVLGMRGGFQLKPLHFLHAAGMTEPKFVPVILNTPFTLMKSYGSIEETPLLISDAVPSSPFITLNKQKQNSRPNIILLILESFGTDYTGTSGTPYTPFLDSLSRLGTFYPNAYANGKKSMEGIPAILASVPSWMETPFVSSPFMANKIDGLAGILSRQGYETAFFHGSRKGSMNIDAFALLSGFKRYESMETYPDATQHYDGNWGIYDEPYFRYFTNAIDQMSSPFLGALFTLSSHHPYAVPDSLEDMLPEGTLPIHKSVAYTDLALRRFFDAASQKEWFNKSLFIITADHTGPTSSPYYSNRVGMFDIPLIIYRPGQSPMVDSTVVSQLDIPTLTLQNAGYAGTTFSLGNHPGEEPAAVQYHNGIYQVITDEFVLMHSGDEPMGLYNYRKDSLLTNNLQQSEPEQTIELEKLLAGKLAAYFIAVKKNQMVP